MLAPSPLRGGGWGRGRQIEAHSSSASSASLSVFANSQPSFRLRWLLDRRTEVASGGPHWTARDAEAENAESAWHAAGARAEAALAALGADDEAVHWIRRATKLNPAAPSYRSNLGEILRRGG